LTRFYIAFKAIAFTQNKKKEITLQIKNGIGLNNKYGSQDFKFLEDIADLVIRAKKAFMHIYLQVILTEQG
jgi:hypothetical protein